MNPENSVNVNETSPVFETTERARVVFSDLAEGGSEEMEIIPNLSPPKPPRSRRTPFCQSECPPVCSHMSGSVYTGEIEISTEEVLEETCTRDFDGFFSEEEVRRTEELINEIRTDRKLWNTWRKFIREHGVTGAIKWIASQPIRGFMWCTKFALRKSNVEGAELLADFLEYAGKIRDGLSCFMVKAKEIIIHSAFDLACLATHLATSTWKGQVFSVFEFIWRQFKEKITTWTMATFAKVWNTYILPLIESTTSKKVSEKPHANAPRDLTDHEKTSKAMGIGAAVVGSLIAGNDKPDKNNILALVNKWGLVGRSLGGLELGRKAVYTWVTAVVGWIREATMFFFPQLQLGLGVEASCAAIGVDLKSYLRLHRKFSEPARRKELAAADQTEEDLYFCQLYSYRITAALASGNLKISPESRTQFNVMKRDIDDFAKYYEKYARGPAQRRTPMHIQLYGAPGCGKSGIMNRLAIEVPQIVMANGGLPHGEPTFEFDDKGDPIIYTKGGSSKHDDGYLPSCKVAVIDDMFAGKGDTTDQSEALWMIRAVSGICFPLPMADLSDKGMRFSSLFLVSSTNDPYPEFPEVRNNEAIWRRRNLLVEMDKDGFHLLEPRPEKTPAKPFPRLHTFKSEDEFIKFCGFKTHQFLNLPMQGTRRLEKDDLELNNQTVERFEDICVGRANAPFSGEDEFYAKRMEEQYEQAVRRARIDREARERQSLWDREREFFVEFNEVPVRPEVVCEAEAEMAFQYDCEYADFAIEDPCTCCNSQSCDRFSALCCIREDYQGPFRTRREDFGQALQELDLWGCDVRERIHTRYEILDISFFERWRHLCWQDLTPQQRCVIEFCHSEAWYDFDGTIFDNGVPVVNLDATEICWDLYHVSDPNPVVGAANAPLREDNPFGSGCSICDKDWSDCICVDDDIAAMELSRWDWFCVSLNKIAKASWRGAKEVSRVTWNCFLVLVNWATRAILGFIELVGKMVSFYIAAILAIFIVGYTVRTYCQFTGVAVGQANTLTASGDAKTARAARLRMYNARANAVTKAIEAASNQLTKEGCEELIPEVVKVLENYAEVRSVKRTRDVVFEKNVVLLRLYEGKEQHTMQGIGIRGNVVLVPWHFARKIKGDMIMDVKRYGMDPIETRIGPSDVHRCENLDGTPREDEAFITVNVKAGHYKDLIQKRHFVRAQDADQLHNVTGELYSRREADDAQTAVTIVTVRRRDTTKYTDQENVIILPKSYEYKAKYEDSFCGAPLFAFVNGEEKIIGMHVAANTVNDCGWSTCLDHELMEHNSKIVEKKMSSANVVREIVPWHKGEVLGFKTSEISDVNPTLKALTVYPEGEMCYVATLKPSWTERVCNKTDIVRSLIFGVFLSLTQPSVKTGKSMDLKQELRDDPEFTPLNEGAKKFSIPSFPFNRRSMELGYRFVRGEILKLKPVGIPRLLNESEIINGVKAWGYQRLNMLTSAGWPHKRLRIGILGSKGKRFLFENVNPDLEGEPSYRVRDHQLAKDIDVFQRNLLMGKKTFHVMYSNLKDERRSMAKIESGSTRLFDCMSLPYTFMVRKYFGAWAATMNRYCVEGYAAVGIDPEGPQWTELARRLYGNGGNVIAGDFKQWDGKLDPDVMMRACKVINAWYEAYDPNWNAGQDLARESLIDDAIYAYTIYGNTVVYKNQGLPSGMAITADFNSLCNYLYMATAFYDMRPGDCTKNFESVECTFYGDDHILAPAWEIQKWFNFNTLQRYYLEKNITYTDALKRGGECPDFMKLYNEASYLKRRFVQHHEIPAFILAPIEEQSITELCNWVRNTLPPEDALMANLQDFKKFSYHHGRSFYDRATGIVNARLERYIIEEAPEGTHIHTITETFDEMDKQWLSRFNI